MFNKITNNILAIMAQKKIPSDIDTAQWKTLKKLLALSNRSEFGKKYDFDTITSIKEYQKRVPIMHYSDLESYWHREALGESLTILNSPPSYFVESSGTTGTNKLIPISEHVLKEIRICQKILMGTQFARNPKHEIFNKKILYICAQAHRGETEGGIPIGMISGILHGTTSKLISDRIIPARETVNISDRDEKLKQIAFEIRGKTVGAISGIPSSVVDLLVYLKEHLSEQEYTTFTEPVEMLLFSGINYRPYKKRLIELLGKEVAILDFYMSSEGVYGCESIGHPDEMNLFYNSTFFEFIPFDEYLNNDYSNRLLMSELKEGEQYVPAVTTGSAAFSYIFGDVLECTQSGPNKPLHIKIAGRTELTLNIASEKTSITEVEQAVELFMNELQIDIKEFFLTENRESEKPSYHWYFEETSTLLKHDIQLLNETLDRCLAETNSLYAYFKDEVHTMGEPLFSLIPSAQFEKWFEIRHSDANHRKIPRIILNSGVIDALVGNIL